MKSLMKVDRALSQSRGVQHRHIRSYESGKRTLVNPTVVPKGARLVPALPRHLQRRIPPKPLPIKLRPAKVPWDQVLKRDEGKTLFDLDTFIDWMIERNQIDQDYQFPMRNTEDWDKEIKLELDRLRKEAKRLSPEKLQEALEQIAKDASDLVEYDTENPEMTFHHNGRNGDHYGLIGHFGNYDAEDFDIDDEGNLIISRDWEEIKDDEVYDWSINVESEKQKKVEEFMKLNNIDYVLVTEDIYTQIAHFLVEKAEAKVVKDFMRSLK